MTEVESHPHPTPFGDEQSPVASVEVKDSESPVLRIVVGKEHAVYSTRLNFRYAVGPLGGSLDESDFDRQAVAPPVLLHAQAGARSSRHRRPGQDRGHARSRPIADADTDMHTRVGEDVLNPLRFEAVLGQDVHTSVGFDKPDFNFARQAGFAADGGEVEEWSVGVHRSKRIVAMPCLKSSGRLGRLGRLYE